METTAVFNNDSSAGGSLNDAKLCKVCGDSATGYNYLQLTCESCKVFFHRYSLKLDNRFFCKSENSCPVTVSSRIKCKACRLQRCYDVGMVRSVVRSNVCSNGNGNNLKTTHTSTSAALIKSTNSSHFISTESPEFLEQLFTRTVPTFLISPCSGLSSMSTSTPNFRLSDYEFTKVKEILDAQAVIVDERKLPVVAHSTDYYDSFISGEVYTRMYIRFCKRMDLFRTLPNDLQMAILKPFCFDICLLRMAFNINMDTGEWPSLMDNDRNTVFLAPFNYESMARVVPHHHDKFMENHHFVRRLQEEMESDPIIRDLLIAVVMFRNYPSISCSEFIQYNYFFYRRLLEKYLEMKYCSRLQAATKLESLVSMTANFDRIKTNERLILKQMDLAKVSEVYCEIFELK